MNIIAVDDERFALKKLQSAIENALPGGVLSCFDKPSSACVYAGDNLIDVAFLDIEMGGMNGLQLAKRLKDIRGSTNIIFVTAHQQYAADAFAIHASGYIIKPVSPESVAEAMEYLRHPVKPAYTSRRLRVQTFGNFEVFAGDTPLRFVRTKTKELLAYLVSRNGAMCGNDEISSVIWEDKEDTGSLKAHLRLLVGDLMKTLKDAGMSDVIIKRRGALGIVPEKISCDLYDFYAGIGVNSYMGEFMSQYDWAEFTNGYLDRVSRQNLQAAKL